MTPRYQVVFNCPECMYCRWDEHREGFYCDRHEMEPLVDGKGIPQWCFLLTAEEVVDVFIAMRKREGGGR